MSGRAAAWWRALCNDLRSAGWVAANARQVLHSAQVLFDMQVHGGTVIEVPEQRPVIRTLVQLDGDFVTFVDDRLFREGRSPDELAALITQHQQALRARLPALDPAFTDHLRGCVRLLRWAWLPGSLSLEGLGGATLPAVWHAVQPFLLLQAVSVGIPSALHFGAPRLLRLAFRRGWPHRLRPPVAQDPPDAKRPATLS